MEFGQEKTLFLNFGTSQDERILAALMPENICIDDRQIQDYMVFCIHVADMIHYVDFNNEIDGSWYQFFEKDPSIFLALLINEQPEKLDNEIRSQIQKFYQSRNQSEPDAIKLIVDHIEQLIQKINYWYVNSMALLIKQTENPITEVLSQVIEAAQSSVRSFFEILNAIDKKNWFTVNLEWQNQLHPHWGLKEGKGKEYRLDSALVKAQHQVIEELRQIFQTLHIQTVFLNQKALHWFHESLQNKKDHEPHVALLLSFLQLFLHERNQINTYSKKHLDHFYLDWLRQSPKPFTPDRTIVCFELADQIRKYHLPKGVELLADVNENGLASLYKTIEPVLLNNTKIGHLQTLYISKSALQQIGSSYQLVAGIYAAPIANSKDGLGTPFLNKEDSWPPFGEEQLEISLRDRQMVDATIGFVIAAPILWLQEGDREIELQFQLNTSTLGILLELIDDISENTKQDTGEVVADIFHNSLQFFASTAQGWFQINRWKIDDHRHWRSTSAITLHLFLSGQDPAIVDNLPEVLGENYPSPWPLLKIVLNPAHHMYLYSFVSELELDTLQITTRVEGIKSLSLLNEVGPIDSSAPFLPFGPIPGPKSYLLVGCQELFSKRISDLKLHLEWNNLPEEEGGFAEYFQEYQQGVDNDSYQVQVSALSGSVFKPNPPLESCTFPLFNANTQNQLLSHTSISGIPVADLNIKPEYNKRVLSEYTPNVHSGYLKLQLQGPKMAFGHSLFNHLFSKAMIEQAQASGSFLARLTESPKEIAFPKQPFTPQAFRIKLDYTAHTRLHFHPNQTEENDEYAQEKVIRLYPYGQQEIFFDGRAIDRFLFPQFEADGYLFIGLSQAVPGQHLNLFFYLNESKKANILDELNIQWHYLYLNQWEPFSPDAILADYTNKFTTSGIIKLVLPNDIQTDNALMPPGVFWIRASATGNLEIAGRVLNVQTNAVEVVWVDNGDSAHFDPKVPRPYIQGLSSGISEIALCQQVLPFYGDRPQERTAAFYTRVSERLRHKNRGITNWDIEHLVLEQFPELLQVKCVGPLQTKAIQPGELKVVVVPKIAENTLEPKIGFNQLESIEKYIAQQSSTFVQLKVINPVYEKIKINVKIFLLVELEPELGVYLKRLHEEILYFICPWLKSGVLPLGGYISKNALFDFIKGRPYIKFATGFSLVHIFQQKETEYKILDTAVDLLEDELIKASTPWSVLVPLVQHNIQFLDSARHLEPEAIAIERMRLGTDFIVGAEEDQRSEGVRAVPSPKPEPAKKTWFLTPNFK